MAEERKAAKKAAKKATSGKKAAGAKKAGAAKKGPAAKKAGAAKKAASSSKRPPAGGASHEQIAERAYDLYERGHGGDAVEHWLQAERELNEES